MNTTTVPDTAEAIFALDEAGLIAIVKDAQAPVFARAKACQRLAVVGTRKCVPALAGLLADAKMAHYARYGLEPIADPGVDTVLLRALKRLRGRARVGVISSLAARRTAKSLGALKKLAGDSDAETAEAARAAVLFLGSGNRVA
jgi:hypothetical protein